MTRAPLRSSAQWVTPSFVVAVVLLGAASVLSGPAARRMAFKQIKQPLPLRIPLAELDDKRLTPFRVIHRQLLDPSIIEALGTDQYLSWTFEDTSVAANDPLRLGSLFVTYYTGGASLVPHTPDVCYLGVGYDATRPHENVDLAIATSTASKVPVRVCTFAKTAVFAREEISVVYTFSVNGRLAATQHYVRVLINDLSNTFAYFSKVEVSFPRATREQSLEGAKKLFQRVLPVLEQNHWPEFDRAEHDARQSSKGTEAEWQKSN